MYIRKINLILYFMILAISIYILRFEDNPSIKAYISSKKCTYLMMLSLLRFLTKKTQPFNFPSFFLQKSCGPKLSTQGSGGRGMAIGSKLKRTKAGMCQNKTAHIQTNPLGFGESTNPPTELTVPSLRLIRV